MSPPVDEEDNDNENNDNKDDDDKDDDNDDDNDDDDTDIDEEENIIDLNLNVIEGMSEYEVLRLRKICRNKAKPRALVCSCQFCCQ